MLLEFPRALPAGGGAALPGPGVVLSESSADSPEERRQHDVPARLRPLLLVLAGEPEVRRGAIISPQNPSLSLQTVTLLLSFLPPQSTSAGEKHLWKRNTEK